MGPRGRSPPGRAARTRRDGVDAACSCVEQRLGEAAAGGGDVERDAVANSDLERG